MNAKVTLFALLTKRKPHFLNSVQAITEIYLPTKKPWNWILKYVFSPIECFRKNTHGPHAINKRTFSTALSESESWKFYAWSKENGFSTIVNTKRRILKIHRIKSTALFYSIKFKGRWFLIACPSTKCHPFWNSYASFLKRVVTDDERWAYYKNTTHQRFWTEPATTTQLARPPPLQP